MTIFLAVFVVPVVAVAAAAVLLFQTLWQMMALLMLLFIFYYYYSCYISCALHLQVQHPLRLVVFALLRAFQFSFKIQMKMQTR